MNTLDQKLYAAAQCGRIDLVYNLLKENKGEAFTRLANKNHAALLAVTGNPMLRAKLKVDKDVFANAIAMGEEALNYYLCDVGRNTQIETVIQTLIQKIPGQYLHCAARAQDFEAVKQCLQSADFKQLTQRNHQLLILATSPKYPKIQEALKNNTALLSQKIFMGGAVLDYYLLYLADCTKTEEFKAVLVEIARQPYQPAGNKLEISLIYSAAQRHDLFMLYLLFKTAHIFEEESARKRHTEWRDSYGYNALAIALASHSIIGDVAEDNLQKSLKTAELLMKYSIEGRYNLLPAAEKRAGWGRFYDEREFLNAHAQVIYHQIKQVNPQENPRSTKSS